MSPLYLLTSRGRVQLFPTRGLWGCVVPTFHDTSSMLMFLVDADQTPYMTGDDGTVTITDRRTVPGLWDLEPMMFVDENGEGLGLWTLTPETWIWTICASFKRASAGRTFPRGHNARIRGICNRSVVLR